MIYDRKLNNEFIEKYTNYYFLIFLEIFLIFKFIIYLY